MAYFNAKKMNPAVKKHVQVFEVFVEKETRLNHVIEVNTNTGYVIESVKDTNGVVEQKRRLGYFIIRDARTGQLWPE